MDGGVHNFLLANKNWTFGLIFDEDSYKVWSNHHNAPTNVIFQFALTKPYTEVAFSIYVREHFHVDYCHNLTIFCSLQGRNHCFRGIWSNVHQETILKTAITWMDMFMLSSKFSHHHWICTVPPTPSPAFCFPPYHMQPLPECVPSENTNCTYS